MPTTQSLTSMCDELLATYPESAGTVDGTGPAQLLTIMVADGHYVDLLAGTTKGRRQWSSRQRGVTRFAQVTEGGNPALRNALTAGLPLPAGGTLFGWQHDGATSALVLFYSGLNPSTEPTWALCPRAGIPQDTWPPFAGEPLVGPWFWTYLRAGQLADLGPLVARTRDTVFGIDCGLEFRGYCFAVKADVRAGEHLLLPRGRYADYQAFREGLTPPSLNDLLADKQRVDLGPRLSAS